MRKASNEAYEVGADEEGAANAAASLGPDGGPLLSAKVRYAKAAASVDEDDAWLDDELSDEELAALGEEDFDEDMLAEDFDVDDVDVDDSEDFSFEPPPVAPAAAKRAEPQAAKAKTAKEPPPLAAPGQNPQFTGELEGLRI
ncbi:MAG: hypothetical protein AB7V02_06585, partial [Parvularculaceae bacterium]